MSQTMETADVRQMLSCWCEQLTDMYVKDLKAIPEDKITATFGGVSRSAAELTVDTLALAQYVTKMLRDEPLPAMEPGVWGKDFKGITTQSGLIEAVQKVSKDLGSAISGCESAKFNMMITAPWGDELPMSAMANIAVNHIWYHDGQLNYIQSLLGDGEMHWM